MSTYLQVRRRIRPTFDVAALDRALAKPVVPVEEAPPTVRDLKVTEALAAVCREMT